MPRFPYEEIPATDTLPTGEYELECTEMELRTTKSGKLMYVGKHRVIDGPEGVGGIHFENYVLGTDDDPDGEEMNKETMGVRRLGQLFKACKVPPSNDLDLLLEDVRDKRFIGRIVTKEQTEGEYKGEENSNIVKYYSLGTRNVGAGKEPTNQGRPASRQVREEIAEDIPF